MKYFYDTYALIETLGNNSNYKIYASEDFVTSILNLGELYLYFLKTGNEMAGKIWCDTLKTVALDFDYGILIDAMKMKYFYKNKKLSFIDCVGYILAKQNDLIFLTGDNGFKDLDNVEFVK